MNDQSITPENFWEKHDQYEKDTLKKLSKEMKVKTAWSFTWYLSTRIFKAVITIPASLAFVSLLYYCWTDGAIETLNLVFSSLPVEKVTLSGDIKALSAAWLALSILDLIFLLAVDHWKSPAKKETEYLMQRWWGKHSHLIPSVSIQK
ncbi:hypothetical protein [Hydrogenovibrio marinus]|uniref:SMODS and SLOG-associating 2TM effector domain-containing protein n=1 Tax=Hydrogenovibrio marinus TaxID=28885 RepID=A0A066ZLN5_HYDMR|nr:hypothetical protein [Hydrogenovibrio marinus]KDN94703.1 hypothetical protein EI16_12465 [Hydrogenovibrio marinus]